jgi:hypothetical protein
MVLVAAAALPSLGSVTVSGYADPYDDGGGLPTRLEASYCRVYFSDENGTPISSVVTPNALTGFYTVTFDLTNPPIQNLLSQGLCTKSWLSIASPDFHLNNVVDGTSRTAEYLVTY